MLYIECEEYKNKYHESLIFYNDILDEQSMLFLKTQPGATKYDKEVVSGSRKESNPFVDYLIEKEKKDIDNRLQEAYKILQGRKLIYEMKLEELRHSNDLMDKIYRYHYIEHLSSRKMESRVYLSKSEICRKLEIIEKNIKSGQKGTKVVVE